MLPKKVAEGVGFEPTRNGFPPLRALQARPIGRTLAPLHLAEREGFEPPRNAVKRSYAISSRARSAGLWHLSEREF